MFNISKNIHKFTTLSSMSLEKFIFVDGQKTSIGNAITVDDKKERLKNSPFAKVRSVSEEEVQKMQMKSAERKKSELKIQLIQNSMIEHITNLPENSEEASEILGYFLRIMTRFQLMYDPVNVFSQADHYKEPYKQIQDALLKNYNKSETKYSNKYLYSSLYHLYRYITEVNSQHDSKSYNDFIQYLNLVPEVSNNWKIEDEFKREYSEEDLEKGVHREQMASKIISFLSDITKIPEVVDVLKKNIASHRSDISMLFKESSIITIAQKIHHLWAVNGADFDITQKKVIDGIINGFILREEIEENLKAVRDEILSSL